MKLRVGRLAAASTIALAAAIPALAPAHAATTTQVVTEANIARQPENTPPTKNWVLYTRNAGNGAFEEGPGTPPAGTGSLNLTTPTGADKATLFNYDHIGTALADIDALGYSTYRTSGGSPNQVPALNIEVDVNGPETAGGFTTLVFEPVYNTDQGAIVDGQWQTWNAFGNATWWSTKDIPGVCAFTCYVSWNDIVAANPDATILGGFGVNQGSGNPALDANADALTIGVNGDSTVYDFETHFSPTSADQCKNGGYTQFNNPTFRNQGQCVSYAQANDHAGK